MSKIRYNRSADRMFNKSASGAGVMQVARDVSKDESNSFGVSVSVFERFAMEWTVTYDEFIYGLDGELTLETKEGTFSIGPGDSIWLPEGTWMVYKAESAKVLIVVHPVNWRDLQGKG